MPSPRLALTRTYLAPTDPTVAPGGGELPGVVDVSAEEVVETEETQYDTSDLALAAAGVSVRRQSGGTPRGWILELPGRGPRTHEVRHALGRAVRTAPAALQRLTWAAARGRNIGPVLSLTTRAAQRDLLDADGLVVARLTTREVAARALVPEDSLAQVWSEWQVEVVDGRRDLLDAITSVWESVGAVESDRTAQVRAVLDGPDEVDAETVDAEPEGGSAGDLVLGQLATDVSRLLAQDPLARIDAPDAVRSMRVATRRLSAVLTAYAGLFEEGPREALTAEIDWLAGVLDAARTSELLTERLLADLDEEALGHSVGSGVGDPAQVAETLRAELARRHAAVTTELTAALDSDRYRDLVSALESFVAVPPVTGYAAKSARKTLLPLVEDAHRAVKAAHRDLDPDGDDGEDDTEAHLGHLRAATSTVRYAASLLVPLRGDAVDDYVDAVKELQDLLDEQALTESARTLLEELVPTAGQGAFVLGRLHALEEVRAAVSRHDLDELWATANRKKLRRWMS